jgi:DNA primase
LSDVLEKASEAYRKHLKQSSQAIAYLKGRGLSGEVARQFGLGYAPEGWRTLASVFANYQDPLLVESGLVIHHQEDGQDEKRYDRFRDRVMFPIRNVKGECIGFGGRVLGDGTPKYLNSPETPVFSKGRELYGLFEARQALRDAGYALVTEGYMDVVALAQMGFPNAVATLGTACTTDHVQKLFRFTDAVVFSFDGDAAGRRAARKALDGALPYATDVRSVKFLFLPPEHDPDSYIRAHGRDAFARCITDALPLSRFLMEIAREGCDLGHAEGRALLASQAKPLWQALPEGVLKTQLLGDIAELVEIGNHELLQVWHPEATGKPDARRSSSRYPNRQGERRPGPFTPSSAPPSGRRQPASRQDRAVQGLFLSMHAWDTLSQAQHALLCALPFPHGAAFIWLEQQLHEHGPQPWPALREGLRDSDLENWLVPLVQTVPPDMEFDASELASILHEMEKADLSAQLTAMAPRVGSDPAIYERFKTLSARFAQLKSLAG